MLSWGYQSHLCKSRWALSCLSQPVNFWQWRSEISLAALGPYYGISVSPENTCAHKVLILFSLRHTLLQICIIRILQWFIVWYSTSYLKLDYQESMCLGSVLSISYKTLSKSLYLPPPHTSLSLLHLQSILDSSLGYTNGFELKY